MANVGIGFGILLMLLGIGAYFVTGSQSVTALIPAFFGVPMAGLGFMARDASRIKLAMHVSAVLALVGFLGSVRGIPGVIALATGGEVARPEAAVVQTVMAVLCAAFLVLAVKSFVILGFAIESFASRQTVSPPETPPSSPRSPRRPAGGRSRCHRLHAGRDCLDHPRLRNGQDDGKHRRELRVRAKKPGTLPRPHGAALEVGGVDRVTSSCERDSSIQEGQGTTTNPESCRT